MQPSDKKKLTIATFVYWILLLYIIAALIWWFVSLERQNDQMAALRIETLNTLQPRPDNYQQQLEIIKDQQQRGTTKYLGEGLTFLALILVGAFYVFRAVRQQIKAQQQQQNFMMAITHELKTPIAVTKLNLETLQKHQLDDARRNKILQMTLQETNRLNTLTNNILVSSQLEGNRYSFTREELNLSDLATSAVNEFKHRFPDRNWEMKIEEEVEVTGDSLLLTILLNNLLENAYKYAPATEPISCELKQHQSQILLSVSDRGVGIPDEEKKKVFEKFYRIGNESTRTAKGTGLGLYLCKKIAADHNADIYVTDNTPTGTTFVVAFKK